MSYEHLHEMANSYFIFFFGKKNLMIKILNYVLYVQVDIVSIQAWPISWDPNIWL